MANVADYNVANASGASVRADINNILQAVVTLNSGTSAPSTMYPFMIWIDTNTNLVKMRNGANDAWLTMPFAMNASNTAPSGLTVSGGDLTVDTSTLKVDSTNNRVGIGTASPARDMVLVTEGATNGFRIESADESLHFFGAGGSSGTGADDGYFAQYSQGTAKNVIYANGNTYFNGGPVGIGNTLGSFHSSVLPLVVGSGSGDEGMAIFSGNASKGKLGFADAASDDSGSYRGYFQYDHSGDNLNIGTAGSERMRITSDGKVGISTASPDTMLHVHKATAGSVTANSNTQLTIENNDHAGLQFLSPNDANSIIYFGDVDDNDVGYINYAHASNSMNFQTNASLAMTILSDGETLVGTTSTMSAKFGVTQSSATAFATDTSASSTSYTGTAMVTSVSRNTTDTTYHFWKCQRRGYANSVLVNSGGTFTTANNSYGAISDQRLKTDIIDSGSQWDDIKALRVRKYKMIQDPDSNVHLGVISQELEASGMSGLVEEKDADEYEIAAVDDESILKEGDKTKTVRYSVLYMKSIKALQEAITRIETLEARITALES